MLRFQAEGVFSAPAQAGNALTAGGNRCRSIEQPGRCEPACWEPQRSLCRRALVSQAVEPWSEWRALSLDDEDGGSRTTHKQIPQIGVAALADAEKSRLATGRVLPGHESEPR